MPPFNTTLGGHWDVVIKKRDCRAPALERKLVTLRQITQIHRPCSLRLQRMMMVTVADRWDVIIKNREYKIGDTILSSKMTASYQPLPSTLAAGYQVSSRTSTKLAYLTVGIELPHHSIQLGISRL